MRSVHSARWPAVAAVLLVGCVDLAGLVDRPPPSLVQRDGLTYQVMVTESRYAYDAFEYRVRITNTSYGTVERWLPADLATPRVYRDGRWTRPVWDPCGWGCPGWHDRVRVRLRHGEALEGWRGRVDADDFASWGRGGVYHLVLVIDTGDHRFEVLGLPEIRVY